MRDDRDEAEMVDMIVREAERAGALLPYLTDEDGDSQFRSRSIAFNLRDPKQDYRCRFCDRRFTTDIEWEDILFHRDQCALQWWASRTEPKEEVR